MNRNFGSSSNANNASSASTAAGGNSGGNTLALVSLILFKYKEDEPVVLSQFFNLSIFNFFVRSQMKPLIVFNSRLVVSRTSLGGRQRIALEKDVAHVYVYVHPCGLACTCAVTPSYPMRVAFGLLNEAIRKFQDKYAGSWESITSDRKENEMFTEEGAELIKAYQNPVEADKLLKVQRDLDEVRDIMLKNVDDILKRGEKLEDLMEKSEHLSNQSVQFYRQAKKNNQCCQLY